MYATHLVLAAALFPVKNYHLVGLGGWGPPPAQPGERQSAHAARLHVGFRPARPPPRAGAQRRFTAGLRVRAAFTPDACRRPAGPKVWPGPSPLRGAAAGQAAVPAPCVRDPTVCVACRCAATVRMAAAVLLGQTSRGPTHTLRHGAVDGPLQLAAPAPRALLVFPQWFPGSFTGLATRNPPWPVVCYVSRRCFFAPAFDETGPGS